MAFIDLRGVSAWTLVRRTLTDFVADELPTYASALAFQLFFSLFPFLLFLIALIGVLDAQPFFDWLHQQAELVLPREALGLVDPVIAQLQTQQAGLFSVGILLALWTSSAAVRSTMAAMNRAYGVEDGRPAWKLVPLSVLYT